MPATRPCRRSKTAHIHLQRGIEHVLSREDVTGQGGISPQHFDVLDRLRPSAAVHRDDLQSLKALLDLLLDSAAQNALDASQCDLSCELLDTLRT